MAKIRLNKTHRDYLLKFALANSTVDKTLVAATKSAKALFNREFKKAHKKAYPEADMKILKKYGCTQNLDNINIKYSELYSDFCYAVDLPEKFLFPSGYKHVYYFNDVLGEAVRNYEIAEKELNRAINQQKADFKAMIYNNRYFEDLCEDWPTFIRASAHIAAPGTAMTTLGADTRNRIKDYKVIPKKDVVAA